MKLSSILSNAQATQIAGGDPEISHITADSRLVRPGSLFVCLVGTLDGHDYIDEATRRGAAAIIVQRHVPHAAARASTIAICPCTRRAYAICCANFYGNPAKKLCLLGVTGTNGKTTTTWMLDNILRRLGCKTGLIGTLGAFADGRALGHDFVTGTTPDPPELHKILSDMHAQGITHAVLEVSSHALHLQKLADITFDAGIYTNLSQDHLDFHGTMDNYARAKAMLFAQSRRAVINTDCPYAPIMAADHADVLTYGLDCTASLMAADISAQDCEFDLVHENVRIGRATTGLRGRFNVYNALAAAGAALMLGYRASDVLAVLADLPAAPGRLQYVQNPIGARIFIDYAHTPQAILGVCEAVRPMTPGRLIIVFGCGGERDRDKRAQMGRAAGDACDYVIVTSDNPRSESPRQIIEQIMEGLRPTGTAFDVLESRMDAIACAVAMLAPADSLIIAGKGHEDYQIIGSTKHPFCDLQAVRSALDTL